MVAAAQAHQSGVTKDILISYRVPETGAKSAKSPMADGTAPTLAAKLEEMGFK